VQVVVVILGCLALAAWASAAVHGLLLLRHVAPPRSGWSLLWQGWRFYDRSTFTERAHPLHRRFLLSCAAFAAIVVLLIASSVIAAGTG
jgi:hypothetical protein